MALQGTAARRAVRRRAAWPRSRSEAAATEHRSRRLPFASASKVGERSGPLGRPVLGVGEGPRPRRGSWRRQGTRRDPGRGTFRAPWLRGISEVRIRGGTRAGPVQGCGARKARGPRAGSALVQSWKAEPKHTEGVAQLLLPGLGRLRFFFFSPRFLKN